MVHWPRMGCYIGTAMTGLGFMCRFQRCRPIGCVAYAIHCCQGSNYKHIVSKVSSESRAEIFKSLIPCLVYESINLLGKRFTFALYLRKSGCRLSVVCNVDAPNSGLFFRKYLCTIPNSVGTRAVCVKILVRNDLE